MRIAGPESSVIACQSPSCLMHRECTRGIQLTETWILSAPLAASMSTATACVDPILGLKDNCSESMPMC